MYEQLIEEWKKRNGCRKVEFIGINALTMIALYLETPKFEKVEPDSGLRIFGIPVVIDPDLPYGRIELRYEPEIVVKKDQDLTTCFLLR